MPLRKGKNFKARVLCRYCDEMGQFRMRQCSLPDFYFREQVKDNVGTASKQKKSMLRLAQEISSLTTSLPTSWATSVFLVTEEDRMDIIR